MQKFVFLKKNNCLVGKHSTLAFRRITSNYVASQLEDRLCCMEHCSCVCEQNNIVNSIFVDDLNIVKVSQRWFLLVPPNDVIMPCDWKTSGPPKILRQEAKSNH